MNTLIARAKKPTPRFFKKLRTIGLSIAAIGATIIASPVTLPAIVIKIAGYLAVAGSVMSGVSQVTVKNERQ
jgi:hypothetical protein